MIVVVLPTVMLCSSERTTTQADADDYKSIKGELESRELVGSELHHPGRDMCVESGDPIRSWGQSTCHAKAPEVGKSLHGTNRLMEAELEILRRQQQLWLQERSQHEETKHRLLAAEAKEPRKPILEQQVEELKGHKETVEHAQLNEDKARSEVAHLKPAYAKPIRRVSNVLNFSLQMQAYEFGNGASGIKGLTACQPVTTQMREGLKRGQWGMRRNGGTKAQSLTPLCDYHWGERISCVAVRAGSASRRLADEAEGGDTDDELLDSILNDCLDMEEASGLLRHHFMSSTPAPLTATGQEAAFVAPGDSIGFRAVQPFASSLEGVTSPLIPTYASTLAPGSLSYFFDGQTEGFSFPALQTSSVGLPAVAAEEVSGLVDLTQISSAAWVGVIPNILEEFEVVDVATEPVVRELPRLPEQSLALGGVRGNALTEDNAAAKSEITQGTRLEGQEKGAVEAGTACSVQAGAREDEFSSKSPVAVAQPSVASTCTTTEWNGSMHPFVRLPVVPRDAMRRNFDLSASRYCQHRCQTTAMLAKIRELLAQPALSSPEVDDLMSATEALVRYVIRRVGQRATDVHPSKVVRQLGYFFIVLDSVVCVKQILGDRMNVEKWWGQFAESFPTDFQRWRGNIFRSPEVKHAGKLMNRLLGVMEIYKRGDRPQPKEVLSLKKMLFCSKYTPAAFKESRWDSWRDADKSFRAAQGESSDDSTDDEA
ncbi:hypothetical protein Efla_002433 [Eimeria flavescens]